MTHLFFLLTLQVLSIILSIQYMCAMNRTHRVIEATPQREIQSEGDFFKLLRSLAEKMEENNAEVKYKMRK